MDERSRSSAGYEYAEHIRAVLERAAEVKAAEGHVIVARTPLLLRTPVVILLTVGFMSVVIWNLNRWDVVPQPRPRETEEASLQISLVVASQMIEAFREENGRYPASLAEVGLPEDAFSYRVGGDSYEIFASNGGVTVRLDGDEDPVALLRQLRLPQAPEELR